MTDTDYLSMDHKEGTFDIDDYSLYYRQFGDGDEALLTLHGGPGMPHDYLLPLARHGTDERSVYMYDQFGTGRSDRPAPGDFDRYTVEHYRSEVDAVRRSIDADTVHLYGQSWGGMLALEYALEYGDCIESLVLANTLADTASAYQSMRGFVDALPEEDREVIESYESRREFDAPEYEEKLDTVYAEHVCRLDEYPTPVEDTLSNVNSDIYGLMWGPNEYVLLETARLRGWSVRDRLDRIEVPTLVLTGRHDEIAPEVARDIAEGIPNSRVHEFAESSHMPFWEQPERHYEVVESFLGER